METNNACRQIKFASTELSGKPFNREDDKNHTTMQSAMASMKVSSPMKGSKKLPLTTHGGGLSSKTSTSNQGCVLNANNYERRAPASPKEDKDGPRTERNRRDFARDHVKENRELPSLKSHASKSTSQGGDRKVLVQSKARGDGNPNLIKQASKMTREPAKLLANSEDKRAETLKQSMSHFKSHRTGLCAVTYNSISGMTKGGINNTHRALYTFANGTSKVSTRLPAIRGIPTTSKKLIRSMPRRTVVLLSSLRCRSQSQSQSQQRQQQRAPAIVQHRSIGSGFLRRKIRHHHAGAKIGFWVLVKGKS
jgi:hypothetical protein